MYELTSENMYELISKDQTNNCRKIYQTAIMAKRAAEKEAGRRITWEKKNTEHQSDSLGYIMYHIKKLKIEKALNMAKHSKETRKLLLNIIIDLTKHLDVLFYEFRKDCKYRDGDSCDHEDYHKDFALAMCIMEKCPIIEQINE